MCFTLLKSIFVHSAEDEAILLIGNGLQTRAYADSTYAALRAPRYVINIDRPLYADGCCFPVIYSPTLGTYPAKVS